MTVEKQVFTGCRDMRGSHLMPGCKIAIASRSGSSSYLLIRQVVDVESYWDRRFDPETQEWTQHQCWRGHFLTEPTFKCKTGRPAKGQRIVFYASEVVVVEDAPIPF